MIIGEGDLTQQVMTTLMSYGAVARHRQAEIMRKLGTPKRPTVPMDLVRQIIEVTRELDAKGVVERPPDPGPAQ